MPTRKSKSRNSRSSISIKTRNKINLSMRRTMVNMETMKKDMEVAILRTRTSRRIQTSTQLQQERGSFLQER